METNCSLRRAVLFSRVLPTPNPAPDSITAYNNAIPALATVSRPICKYPDKLVYNGTGSTNVASSFACKHESHDELMEEQKTLPDADLVEDRHDNHDRDN